MILKITTETWEPIRIVVNGVEYAPPGDRSKDSERLDWIDAHGAGIRARNNGHANALVWQRYDLRSAIDRKRALLPPSAKAE
jgi:hypothetical protein